MVTLNNEQAKILQGYLKAIRSNFKLYQGSNIGSSSVHNIWPNDLRIIDEIVDLIEKGI